MADLELTLRQRKILYMIQNQSDYITSSDLAEALHVSSRTVRNEIREMNRVLAPYDARILSAQSKGFLFAAGDPDRIRRLSRMDTAFWTRAERIRYLAFRLCESDQPLNLYDLEGEIFVSRTTLHQDLRALRQKYSYEPPFIRLLLKRDEIAFEPDELKIRSVLLGLIHEDWDYHVHTNAYYGMQFLDEELIRALTRETPGILKEYRIRTEDPSLIALELTLAIMHDRVLAGHPYPETLPLLPESHVIRQAVEALFALVEEGTGLSYPLSERARICEFLSNIQMAETGEGDGASATADAEAEAYLARLHQVFHVDFSKDTEFVEVLKGFLRQLLAGNTILAQHTNYPAIRESLTAEFELAWLFQELSPSFIDRYLNENELCSLAICFSGAIRHYLEVHPEKKLRALLFSHRSMAVAWALKRQILESMQLYLDITEVLPSNELLHTDLSGTDLVLSTVKPPASLPGEPPLLVVEDHPFSDMRAQAERIKLLSFKRIWPIPARSFAALLNGAYWYEEARLTDPIQIIEELMNAYIRDGLAAEEHRIDLIRRESKASFGIKPGLVFLHTVLPAAETRLSVLTLAHRVRWNDFRVSTVVLGLFREEDRNLLFHLKIRFCNHTLDPDLLRQKKSRKELTAFLLEEGELSIC